MYSFSSVHHLGPYRNVHANAVVCSTLVACLLSSHAWCVFAIVTTLFSLQGCSAPAAHVTRPLPKTNRISRLAKTREPSSAERLRTVEAFLASGGDNRRCRLQRIDARNLTWTAFTEKFRGRPVILTGLEGFFALNWTHQIFLDAFADVEVKINNGRFDRYRTREVATVSQYFSSNDATSNIFLVEQEARNKIKLGSASTHPLFEGFNYRPILSVGMAASPTYVHRHQETWLHLLAGRKVWWLGTDAKKKPSLSMQGDPCASLPSVEAAKVEFEDMELCVQHPGEVMYFGDLTPHATCNLDGFVLATGAQGHTEALPDLHRAVRSNQVKMLSSLLAASGGVDALDDLNRTALQHACLMGNTAAVSQLVRSKAQLEPGAPEPLHTAAEFGNVEALHYLLDARASLTHQDKHGGQAVHYAAKGGQVSTLEFLLEQRASPQAKGESKAEPLHWAAMEGSAATIRFLLMQRADVSTMDASGASALHYAAEHGHVQIITELLAQKADPEAKDNLRLTPVDKAALLGRESAHALLVGASMPNPTDEI